MTELPRPAPGAYGDLQAQILFTPAYYCMGNPENRPRPHCPSCSKGKVANHGRGSVNMWWVLSGHDLAVTWRTSTDWFHPADPYDPISRYRPTSGPLAFHSAEPWGEWLNDSHGKCEFLEGQSCYSDVNYSIGDTAFEILRSGGDAGLWSWMSEQFSQLLQTRNEYEGVQQS